MIWPAASVSARVTSMYPVEWRMRSPKGHCHGNRATPPPMTVRPSPSTTLSSQGNLPGPLPSQLTASVSVRTLVRVTKGACDQAVIPDPPTGAHREWEFCHHLPLALHLHHRISCLSPLCSNLQILDTICSTSLGFRFLFCERTGLPAAPWYSLENLERSQIGVYFVGYPRGSYLCSEPGEFLSSVAKNRGQHSARR